MFLALKEIISDWNSTYGERAKLQHAYLAAGLLGVVLAGLISLLNPEVGQTVLRFCLAGFAIVVANAIVWALLFSFIISKLPTPKRSLRK